VGETKKAHTAHFKNARQLKGNIWKGETVESSRASETTAVYKARTVSTSNGKQRGLGELAKLCCYPVTIPV